MQLKNSSEMKFMSLDKGCIRRDGILNDGIGQELNIAQAEIVQEMGT